MIFYILAILAGFTTIFAMTQNSSLSTKIGLVNMSFLNYITGISTAFIFFLIFANFSDFKGLKGLSPLAYTGGLLGLTVVFISSYVFRHLSVIIASMLLFTGQMVASFIIDYIQGTSLSPLKIAGVILIMLGIYVNNYIDYRTLNKSEN